MIGSKSKPVLTDEETLQEVISCLTQHIPEDWRFGNSWKNTLINYRIMIQPMIIFCMILPWLKIMRNKILWSGFNDLLGCANDYMNHFLTG